MGRAAPLSNGVVVAGARGMLGRAVVSLLRGREFPCLALGRAELDITSAESVRAGIPPGTGVVINCAAYTDVDGAEREPDKADALNALGVAVLAERCREVGAVLVHYGTDYVFDGAGAGDNGAAGGAGPAPYAVGRALSPVNAYGRSKAAGEAALASSGAEYLLLRTSWLYAPWGKNFVRTIARLASERPMLRVVDDQRGRPTSAEGLAETTLALLEAGARGVLHATDGGECTWCGFAQEIVRGLGLPARVEPCTTAEFPRPARRPAYSVLDLSATEALVGPMRPWDERLAGVLGRLERPL
jgi:dTDP-4-dehydrorhamnose reductase